jgi:hypothetical protein
MNLVNEDSSDGRLLVAWKFKPPMPAKVGPVIAATIRSAIKNRAILLLASMWHLHRD